MRQNWEYQIWRQCEEELDVLSKSTFHIIRTPRTNQSLVVVDCLTEAVERPDRQQRVSSETGDEARREGWCNNAQQLPSHAKLYLYHLQRTRDQETNARPATTVNDFLLVINDGY